MSLSSFFSECCFDYCGLFPIIWTLSHFGGCSQILELCHILGAVPRYLNFVAFWGLFHIFELRHILGVVPTYLKFVTFWGLFSNIWSLSHFGGCSQIFELCHIFQQFITCLCVAIFSYILFMLREYMPIVSAVTAGPSSLLAANRASVFFVRLWSPCRPRDRRQTRQNNWFADFCCQTLLYVVHLMAVLVTDWYSTMIWWMVKYWGGSGRGLLELLPCSWPGGTDAGHGMPMRTASVLADIRTKHL